MRRRRLIWRASGGIVVMSLTFSVGAATAAFFSTIRTHKTEFKPLPEWQVATINSTSLPVPPTTVPTPAEEGEKLKSLSPYKIDQFINEHPQADIQGIWERLGITEGAANLFHDRKQFFKTCSGCQSELFEYELDGETGKEVLLRIADNLQEACRYLVFKRYADRPANDGWKLLGHIDADFGRYMMPEHYLVVGGGRTWLAIQVQTLSGTGAAQYEDRLFEIDPRGVHQVLSFTSDGHESSTTDRPDRDFSARIINCRRAGGADTVKIEYSVTYTIGEDWGKKKIQWRKKQIALYKRPPARGEFVFDASQSSLSEAELKSVYNWGSLSDEDFLRYNYAELAKLAVRKDSELKQWLRDFLDYCEETPEKQKLLRLL
ncbi:MAG: hypothetical protein ABR563_03275 [Pyrinomonadaceae bacterium]